MNWSERCHLIMTQAHIANGGFRQRVGTLQCSDCKPVHVLLLGMCAIGKFSPEDMASLGEQLGPLIGLNAAQAIKGGVLLTLHLPHI